MGGDIKAKKENSNQGEEFFYKLSFNKEFQNDLLRARQQLGLPKVGFTKKEARKIWIDNNAKKMLDFLGIQMHLKKKYKIPASFWWELTDDHIFFNKPFLYKKH